MDTSPRQQHRHHYHHHCHFICHHRHRHFICHHSPAPPPPPPPPPPPALQNPEPAASAIKPFTLNSGTSSYPAEAHHGGSPPARRLQEQEYDEEVEEAYEDYDEEPVFVLTDEWKEFFAKSEAKRKLEKKQAKKGNS